MKEELKNCPFCGSGKVELRKEISTFLVECWNCDCNTDWRGTKQEAIKAWNTRYDVSCEVFECSMCEKFQDGDCPY